jgi:hypothetical protein
MISNQNQRKRHLLGCGLRCCFLVVLALILCCKLPFLDLSSFIDDRATGSLIIVPSSTFSSTTTTTTATLAAAATATATISDSESTRICSQNIYLMGLAEDATVISRRMNEFLLPPQLEATDGIRIPTTRWTVDIEKITYRGVARLATSAMSTVLRELLVYIVYRYFHTATCPVTVA